MAGDPDLETRLQDFDGVALTILTEVRAACGDSPGYLDALLQLCIDPRPNMATGATWLLKAEICAGTTLEGPHLDPLTTGLAGLPTWEAQLHICQAIEGFRLSSAQATAVFDWAATLADHHRPFIRAWSVHAMVVLAEGFPMLVGRAEEALSVAETDAAASVKARARNLRKRLSKTT